MYVRIGQLTVAVYGHKYKRRIAGRWWTLVSRRYSHVQVAWGPAFMTISGTGKYRVYPGYKG